MFGIVPMLLIGTPIALLAAGVHHLILKCMQRKDAKPEVQDKGDSVPKYGQKVLDWGGKNLLEPILLDPLTFVGFAKVWRRDLWNLIDIVSYGLLLATLSYTVSPSGINLDTSDMYRDLVVVTALALWLKFLGFVKSLTRELATFVLMINIILYDVKEFVLVLFIFISMFCHVFFLRLGETELDEFGFHDSGQDSPWAPLGQAYQTLYTLGFLGDYDNDYFTSWVDILFADLFV